MRDALNKQNKVPLRRSSKLTRGNVNKPRSSEKLERRNCAIKRQINMV